MKPESTKDSSKMFRFYSDLSDSHVMLSFKGAMSQDTLVEIGDLLRLPDTDVDGQSSSSTIKKLFAIVVEMAQNILFYSSERRYLPSLDREVGIGMLMLMQSEHEYVIACGNQMDNNRVLKVEEKCRHINGLGPDELRRFYSEQRKRENTESAGAGLGLIDIARRSGKALDYSFHKIDETSSFFTLSVSLEKTQTKR